MPTITGDVKTITGAATTVQEVWVHSSTARPLDTGGIILPETVNVAITAGKFTANLEPGPGFIIPIYAGTPGEAIPIVVRPTSHTLAEIIDDGRTFAVKNIDRIGILAEDALKAVQAARNAEEAAARAHDSEHAAATSAANAEKSRASAAESLHSLVDKITQWEPRAAQLAKWQPQYEWLNKNFTTLATTVRGLMDNATQALRSEVSGVLGQVERHAATAGQHALKAEAQAKKSEQAAATAVRTEVEKLKGGAPAAFDTLAEIADRIKNGGTLETELLNKIAEKASLDTLNTLKNKVEGLAVGSIKGLSEALAGKVSTTDQRLTDARTPKAHKHRLSDITDIPSEIAAAGVHQDAANPNSIAARDGTGAIWVTKPSNKLQAANKDYVDETLKSYVRSDDSRLSDARTPTAHRHRASDIDGADKALFERQHTHLEVTWVRRGGVAFIMAESANQNNVNSLRCPDWARPPVRIPAQTYGRSLTIHPDGRLELETSFINSNTKIFVAYPVA